MKFFSRAVSYLFHPAFTPLAGTLIYFIITPKYTTLEHQSGNILPIFILTVIIPIVVYLILRNLHLVTSVFMPSSQERKYPMLINIALLTLILFKVIPNNYIIELYFFFVGLVGAAIASLMLLFLRFKVSLHLMGIGSLLMYLISLSIHFEINVVLAISLVTLILGIVASARLYLKAHTKLELLVGLVIGLLSQLLTIKFWL